MTEPTTIREHWRNVQSRHIADHITEGGHDVVILCRWCDHTWPCPDYADAVAALDLLAAMEDDLATQRDRADEWKRRYEFMESHPSYVPDPAPRGDAP